MYETEVYTKFSASSHSNCPLLHCKDLWREFSFCCRFPADEERKQIWLDRLDLQPRVLTTRSVLVCSQHFRPEDIYKKCVANKWKVFLNPSAIPLVRIPKWGKII